MRKLALALGLLVTLVVGAILIGPSFVDWNAYRPEIQASAKRFTGREIGIDGEIGFQVLPQPRLTVTRLSLKDPAPEAEGDLVRVRALEVDVALFPLLAGEVQVETIRLVAPEIFIERRTDGATNWAGALGDADPGRGPELSLDSLAVENGSIHLLDRRTGRETKITTLNLTAAATSLAGPLSARGDFSVGAIPFDFDLSLGRVGANGRLPIRRLRLGLADQAGWIDFSGRLSEVSTDGVLDGVVNLRTPNIARFITRLRPTWAATDLPTEPLAIQARLRASMAEIALNDMTIRIAKSQIGGAVSASLGENIRFDAALAGGRLDLDALGETLAPKTQGPKGGATRKRLTFPSRLPAIPAGLSGSLDIVFDGVSLGGGVMRQVRLSAALGDGILILDEAGALLPGGSEIRLTGSTASIQGVPQFDGRIELASDNLRRLLHWLGHDVSTVPTNRLANLSLTGKLRLTPEAFQVYGVSLRLDASQARGGIAYRLRGRPSFGLELTVDRLNLDGYLPPSRESGDESGSLLAGVSLDRLEAFDTNLKFKAERLTWRRRSLQKLALSLSLVRGQLSLHEARVADLAGFEIALDGTAEGFSGSPSFVAELSLAGGDMARLAAAMELTPPLTLSRLGRTEIEAKIEGDETSLAFDATARLADGEITALGRVRTPTKVPHFDFGFQLRHGDLPAFLHRLDLGTMTSDNGSRISLDGRIEGEPAALAITAGGILAGAEVRVEGGLTDAGGGATVDLALTASHADAIGLLQGLGVDYRPGAGTLGGVELAGRIRGDAKAVRFEDARLAVGPATVSGRLALDMTGTEPRLEAMLRAGDLDLDALLPAASTTEAEGRWSKTPLRLAALGLLDAEVDLEAERIIYAGQHLDDGKVTFGLEDGTLEVTHAEGSLFGGKLTGKGKLTSGDPSSFDLDFKLAGARLGEAAGALGIDALDGTLSLDGEVGSIGTSAWELAGSSNGTLRLAIEDGMVDGLDVTNLAERLAQSAPEARKSVLETAFFGGRTALSTAVGTWRLANGVARTDDTRATLAGAEAHLKGGLDLVDWSLNLKAEFHPTAVAAAPAIILDLEGPFDGPGARLRAARFLRHLAKR